MKKLILLTGVFLALMTMVADRAQAGPHTGGCTAPIIVSN